MIKRYNLFIKEGLIAIWIIASDLLTKLAAFSLVGDGNSYAMLDNIFSITCVRNMGATFGSFYGQKALLISLTAIVCAALLAMLVLRPALPKTLRVAVLFIFGGAIGNLYDRAVYGSVRDFIEYDFLKSMFNFDFAIGNVADIYLMVGVLLLIVYIFFGYKEGDIVNSGWKKFKADLNV
ncbi:MAG: signal peptidase II [Clostridia bacterium]|nr:signal peptidase II [Clostridia bacterium]